MVLSNRSIYYIFTHDFIQSGCVLKAATFLNPPFMILKEFPGGRVEVNGIDGILLRVLAQKMNFNVELHLTPDTMWGDVYENGTATGEMTHAVVTRIMSFSILGAIKMVMDREVNLTIGYFASTAVRSYYMTASYVYYTSNLVWVIPPGNIITSLEKLLKPFQIPLWNCFLAVLVLVFLIIGILQFRCSRNVQIFVFGRKTYHPNLNFFNILLGGSLPTLPTRNFARAVLAIFMFYCFIIQNSYKGSLFQFMQKTMRQAEYKSTDELLQNNFKFYMLRSSRGLLSGMTKIIDNAIFSQPANFNRMFDEVIHPDFKGALLTSIDHLAYRNTLAFPNRFYRHAPEFIMTNNIVIFMHKQSCLAPEMDKTIIYLVSGGLVQTWAASFIDPNFIKRKTSSKAVALNMDQLYGAFQLLAAGLAISLFTFILEIFSRQKRKRFVERIPFVT